MMFVINFAVGQQFITSKFSQASKSEHWEAIQFWLNKLPHVLCKENGCQGVLMYRINGPHKADQLLPLQRASFTNIY